MTEMYVILVIERKRTCDANNKDLVLVPTMYRAAVLAELTSRGYDANGVKTV